jgi:hypothetical protein
MSRSGRPTKRLKRTSARKQPTTTMIDMLKRQLTQTDPRSHADFLHDMRTRQAAGQLTNPATAALLDQLEKRVVR